MAFNKLMSAVRKGRAGVQGAYAKHLKAAEARAEARVGRARTRLERQKAVADLAREKLVLERQLYEAQAEVKQAKEDRDRARRKAGVVGIGERFRAEGQKLYREGQKAYRGIVAPKKKRRAPTAKRRKRTRGKQ